MVEHFGKGLVGEAVMGEVLIELAEALAVAGDADIKLSPFAVSKVNACDRLDAHLLAAFDKFAHTGSIVDVRQRQGRDAPTLGRLHQLLGRQRTVTQTEIGMTV